MLSFIQPSNTSLVTSAAVKYFKEHQGLDIKNIDLVVRDVMKSIHDAHKSDANINIKSLNREAVTKVVQNVIGLWRQRQQGAQQPTIPHLPTTVPQNAFIPPPPPEDPRGEKKEGLANVMYDDKLKTSIDELLTTQNMNETQQISTPLEKPYYTFETIVIDSRERNDAVYADPYSYQVELNTTFKNIISAELKSADIPRSEYVINSSTNLLHFEETTGTVLTATLTAGNYDADELAAHLKTQLDAAGDSTYTVTNNANTFKFTIVSNGAGGGGVFNIRTNSGVSETLIDSSTQRVKYRTNTVAKIIGFGKTDKTGALTYTSDFRYNLGGEPYVLLFIEELSSFRTSIHGGTSESGSENAFAKIAFDVGLDSVKSFNSKAQDIVYIRKFDPPLASVRQLHIAFKTFDNRYYDFNRLDHTITIELGMINNNLMPVSMRTVV